MRAAGAKLKELYGTQLGQDVIETLLGAGVVAGGQAIFTDMSPEEIAVSTGLGIGAAAVGRPLVGRAGQVIGTRLSNQMPELNKKSEKFLNLMRKQPTELLQQVANAKLAPYAHLPATAQVGQMLGRGYGDNIMQALVGLGAPLVMGGNEDA